MSDEPERGWVLPCPRCLEPNACLRLGLADLDTVACQECGEEFTLADVRLIAERWQPVLRWVESAPTTGVTP
jgi:hypothetical protein